MALGAAVAAAAAEAARLDGAALGETAGTLTKRQSNIFKKATCNNFKHLEKEKVKIIA